MQLTLQAEIDGILAGPESLGSRNITPANVPKAGAIATERRNLSEPDLTPINDLEEDAGADLSLDEYAAVKLAMAYWDLQKIFIGIEYLRYTEGEKHPLFFVQRGLPLR